MSDDPSFVPPALTLMMREFRDCKTPVAFRKRFRGMLRDLRDQSEAFEASQLTEKDIKPDSSKFHIHLHGALDLLAPESCKHIDCRISAANRLARSAGLIGDRVWLSDLFTERFIDFGRPTNERINDVMADMLVLARLYPLIRAGIVRFRSPWMPLCESCKQTFENCVESTAVEAMNSFQQEFKISAEANGHYTIETGNCFEPKMVFVSKREGVQTDNTCREFAQNLIHNQVRSALWQAREASMTGGVVFSNSRVGLASLLRHGSQIVDPRGRLLFEKERDFTIPWVSDLNALQILQLREEASSALPIFREKLAAAMRISDANQLSSTDPATVIDELRFQAAEVRSELDITRKSSPRFWKLTFGIVGLGVSAYGVTHDYIVQGVSGGLMTVINLLLAHKAGHEATIEATKSKPGFLLVKAQDILTHSH